MTKTNLIAALLGALATEASAQTRAFYDTSGGRIGSATTDSQGSTTFDDARGKVLTRETTTGDTTVIRDARGRTVGQFTTGR